MSLAKTVQANFNLHWKLCDCQDSEAFSGLYNILFRIGNRAKCQSYLGVHVVHFLLLRLIYVVLYQTVRYSQLVVLYRRHRTTQWKQKTGLELDLWLFLKTNGFICVSTVNGGVCFGRFIGFWFI